MTGIIDVPGLEYNGGMSYNAKTLVVRFSCDPSGETLSISNDSDIMLSVPFRAVESLVNRTRKKVRKARR